MHSKILEKLIEQVIGEAVTALLDAEDRINGRTLASRLSSMLASEQHAQRREALMLALTEIRAEFSSAREPQDAAVMAFGQSVSDGRKKH